MTETDQDAPHEIKLRKQKAVTIFVTVLGVFLSCAHLFLAIYPWLSETERNIFHFSGFALMCALTYPIWRSEKPTSARIALFIDIAIGVIVCSAAIYLAFAEDWIYQRGVRLSTLDWAASIIVILGAIELTRQRLGEERATALAEKLAGGQWTHDYALTYQEASSLGLPVKVGLPEEVLKLMTLYPQPVQTSGVEYLPIEPSNGRGRPQTVPAPGTS